MRRIVMLAVCIGVLMLVAGVASADTWNTFVIRNANGTSNVPAITENPTGYSGWTLFGIVEGGQKAGWATNDMNGRAVGDIAASSITRHDDVGTPGLSPWGPYINIWIQDAEGDWAILANEPSNVGEWAPGTAYDIVWDTLKGATAKIHEADTAFDMPAGTLTFSDFADYTIGAPASAPENSGSGAPDDLEATPYTAYGFNWVFGDTESNYIGGYLVKDPTLVPVPEPISLIFFGTGLVAVFGFVSRKRMRKSA